MRNRLYTINTCINSRETEGRAGRASQDAEPKEFSTRGRDRQPPRPSQGTEHRANQTHGHSHPALGQARYNNSQPSSRRGFGYVRPRPEGFQPI